MAAYYAEKAMNRLIRCPDSPDWMIQMRRNHTTISKAMVYAANGQHEQAETLFPNISSFKVWMIPTRLPKVSV